MGVFRVFWEASGRAPLARPGRAGSVAAALTGEGGGELDNCWLSAEGVVPAGLTAIVILVGVQHRHLVRSEEGQARGRLPWGWARCLISLKPPLQQSGAQSKLRCHTDPPARSSWPPALPAQAVRPWRTASTWEGGQPNLDPVLWLPVPPPSPGGGVSWAFQSTAPAPLLSETPEVAAGALPEQEQVAFLIAAAAQRLTGYVVVGVGVVSRLRKQVYQPRDPHTLLPPAGLCPHQCPWGLPRVAPCPGVMVTVPMCFPRTLPPSLTDSVCPAASPRPSGGCL